MNTPKITLPIKKYRSIFCAMFLSLNLVMIGSNVFSKNVQAVSIYDVPQPPQNAISQTEAWGATLLYPGVTATGLVLGKVPGAAYMASKAILSPNQSAVQALGGANVNILGSALNPDTSSSSQDSSQKPILTSTNKPVTIDPNSSIPKAQKESKYFKTRQELYKYLQNRTLWHSPSHSTHVKNKG